jgi:hypothetical protein
MKIKWVNAITVLACFVFWLTSHCPHKHVADNPVFQPGEAVEHRLDGWDGIVISNTDGPGGKVHVRWDSRYKRGYSDFYDVEWERE